MLITNSSDKCGQRILDAMNRGHAIYTNPAAGDVVLFYPTDNLIVINKRNVDEWDSYYLNFNPSTYTVTHSYEHIEPKTVGLDNLTSLLNKFINIES